jgi:FKBP-type peptidyl-prolyl cis-trans isomerase FkpA
MLRTVSLSLLTLALCACSASDSDTAASSAAGAAFQTEDEKTLYALGLAIGQSVQQNVQDFKLTPAELELVASGLNDALRGTEPKVDLSVYGARIQPFAQQRMAAAAAEAAAAEKAESAAWVAEMAKEAGAEQSASGVVFIPIAEGTGANPTATSTVRVHYHGTLRDGTVFDSSVERNEPISFPLNGVISCWTEGVQKIKVGGKAKLVCPSDTAYGDQGSGGEIPGGAALAFEVELIAIE